MKTLTRYTMILAVAGSLWYAGQSTAVADWGVGVEIRAVEDFYQPLSDHGYWTYRDPHGWCWYPAYVAEDWQPYTTGHWEWTDDGWYWASEEPWAWACYHYGRWVYDNDYGWLWVPGTEWAPSWVAWREGGGYVGWAPLPPDCYFDRSGFISYQYSSIYPHGFVFVEYANFCRPIYPSFVFSFGYVHHDVIHHTHDCTKVRRHHDRVINEGPSVDEIEKSTSRRIERRHVDDVVKEDVEQRARVERPTVPVNQVDRRSGRVVTRNVDTRDRDGKRSEWQSRVGQTEIRTLNPAAAPPSDKTVGRYDASRSQGTTYRGLNRDRSSRSDVGDMNLPGRGSGDTKVVRPDSTRNAKPTYQNTPKGNAYGREVAPSTPPSSGYGVGKPSARGDAGKGGGAKSDNAKGYTPDNGRGYGWKNR